MKSQALKGMRDLLPAEQTLRDYIQGKILETYRASGFERISTPMLEDMENLDKSDGGDNLNLIFKVMKRGDKLTSALGSGDPKQLSDMGLRYDLTLPLSRFYAANKDKLPHPFKVIQTDRVFRAERPQKGRLREFVQCDIDILGDSSPNAEVELIDVTTRALLRIGFKDFTVNINDRRILRAMLEKMGFAADQLDSVCISFDKMDKIGADGVKAELTEKQLPETAINALADFIAAGDVTLESVASRCADPAIADGTKFNCHLVLPPLSFCGLSSYLPKGSGQRIIAIKPTPVPFTAQALDLLLQRAAAACCSSKKSKGQAPQCGTCPLFSITYADPGLRSEHGNARCPSSGGRPADCGGGQPSSSDHGGCGDR